MPRIASWPSSRVLRDLEELDLKDSGYAPDWIELDSGYAPDAIRGKLERARAALARRWEWRRARLDELSWLDAPAAGPTRARSEYKMTGKERSLILNKR